jgi:hypothetical protein
MIAWMREVLVRSSVARLTTVVLAASLAGCPPQSTSDAGLDAIDGELDAPSPERVDAGRDAALDAGPLPDRSSTVAVCRRVCSTCAS